MELMISRNEKITNTTAVSRIHRPSHEVGVGWSAYETGNEYVDLIMLHMLVSC